VNRRVFISAVAMSILTVPNGAEAQPAGRVYRLGLLHPTSPQDSVMAPTIVKALRELGYVEGQNLTMETRYAEGRVDRLTVLARELVQLRVDVLLAVGSAAIRAAKEATTTIPIVMYGGFDPVAAGFVASLARPGGNVTGVVMGPGSSLTGKRLELLREAVPRVTRVAFLVPDDPNFRPQMEEVQEAATALGIKLLPVEIRGGDYPHAFSMMAGERAAALLVGATPRFVTDRKQIIELAAKHRLPAMYEWPDQVEDGGLMSYGSSQAALLQRVAVLVDRIFKGARPGDLPVEQPTKFELVINRRTAKALGLVLPQSILNRADRTIE
jgi:putative ABC transport system substrate-binding protein